MINLCNSTAKYLQVLCQGANEITKGELLTGIGRFLFFFHVLFLRFQYVVVIAIIYRVNIFFMAVKYSYT